MGCATSKPKKPCPHCRNSLTQRSNSLHIHQSPPSSQPPRRSDGYHVVSFSSSTLGSLNIHFDNKIYTAAGGGDDYLDPRNHEVSTMGLIEAKTWSDMINHKIPKLAPKTPITTPPGEPETINVWEVMEGLDDLSPFRPISRPRSFSFDVSTTPICDSLEQGISISNSNSNLQEFHDSSISPIPSWVKPTDSDSNSNLQEFHDSSISPNQLWLKPTDLNSELIPPIGKSLEELPPNDPDPLRRPAEGKNREKIVVYFTSLRGVRKTYEDCCDVRMILKSMGARVDERDVSMDSGFKQELKKLLGDGFNGGGLPRVFVGETYIGGAEEIRRLHEEGGLEIVLERCERVEEGGDSGGSSGGGGFCEACGDVRFVPCETCSGSCKIYCEEDGGEEEEEEDEDDGGFQRCPDCNENGLIRCPICCS